MVDLVVSCTSQYKIWTRNYSGIVSSLKQLGQTNMLQVGLLDSRCDQVRNQISIVAISIVMWEVVSFATKFQATLLKFSIET